MTNGTTSNDNSGRPGAKKAPGAGTALSNIPKGLVSFLVYVGARFMRDGCQQRASALTFTSLLAMVPLLAVSFAIFAAFPAYDSLKGQAQDYIFQNFVPQVGNEVQGYLEEFTAQTGRLSAVGVCFLAVTAVMLLMTISNTFNQIWQARRPRGLVARLLVFWAVLTLAPLLFGVSISLSSVLFAMAEASGVENYVGNMSRLAVLLPFLFQAAGLTILYLVMPNFPVRRRDAVLGGLFSAALLETLKKGFGLYVTTFPTYQTIYGVMATVPIFLIWVYLSWIIVLLGAEFTASLPEWRGGARRISHGGLPPVRRLSAALAILNALAKGARDGVTLSTRRIAWHGRLGPEALADATRQLESKDYICRTDRNRWVLVRDLDHVTLADLYSDLGLALETNVPRGHLRSAWGPRFEAALKRYETLGRDVMGMPLKELLAPGEAGDGAIDEGEMPEEAAEGSRTSFNARMLALIGLGAATGSS